MSSQISFIISPGKETELFQFIDSELNGYILTPESSSPVFCLKPDDEILSSKYLISLKAIQVDLRYQKQRDQNGGETFSLYPFDDHLNFIPFIEYERQTFDDQHAFGRLYVRSDRISAAYRSDIKKLYSRLQKWVRTHAAKQTVQDGFRFYVIR